MKESLAWPETRQLGYSLRRQAVDEFFCRRAGELAAGSVVLDLGGTKTAKRGRFDIECYPLRVVYANLTAAKQPDLLADAARLPLAEASLDVVICAELLEHVPEPRAVLAEAARVLRPGGRLLITVPFLYRVHADPYDYGRYTAHFWREALGAAGLRVEAIETQGLFWCCLWEMLRDRLLQCGKRGRPARPVRLVLRWLLMAWRGWAVRRDARVPADADPYFHSTTTGYGIVASLPEAGV